MENKAFESGDRVASDICGYYHGLPGKIIRPAQIQYGYGRIYIVELDIGITISLREQHIRRLELERELTQD
mgnify:CR=1 FL=1